MIITPTIMACIWLGTGFFTMACANYMDWHRGCELTGKELFWSQLLGSIFGGITMLLMLNSVFSAIFHAVNSIMSPLNFKIKGRKQD